jgi:hypothetical protein
VPHTWQVHTGGGGRHVVFKNSSKIRCGSLERGIDIRGAGGYITGPACKHASGQRYEWLPQCSPADAPLAEPPEWLLSVIRSRTHCGRPTPVEEWRRIARERVADGERHSTFLKLAGHLIANPMLDPIAARELLLAWNEVRFDPPLSEKDCLGMIENLCEREIAKHQWLRGGPREQ